MSVDTTYQTPIYTTPGGKQLVIGPSASINLMGHVVGNSQGPSFYVNSVGGLAGNDGLAWATPLDTLTHALAKCTANIGNTIYLAEGHAETISGAGGVTVNVAGVSIVGVGNGAVRPTFTFSTSTAATFLVTANNVSINNIVGVTTVDQIVSPFVISGTDCYMNIEWHDGSSVLEAVTCILTTAAADRLNLTLRYEGFLAGSHCATPVKLVGVDSGTLVIHFYGKASTSVVNFATTASTNIDINAWVYNGTTGDYSKTVVDTITGSTWTATGFDGVAGNSYRGGSGSALTTVSTKLTAGTVFYVKKTLVSSTIVAAGIDATLASTGGAIEIMDIILQTDGTGLAAMTNFTLTSNNAKGLLLFLSTAISGLGANATQHAADASTTHRLPVLESGSKITAGRTVADGTGAGTIDIYLVCRRLADGANLVNS